MMKERKEGKEVEGEEREQRKQASHKPLSLCSSFAPPALLLPWTFILLSSSFFARILVDQDGSRLKRELGLSGTRAKSLYYFW